MIEKHRIGDAGEHGTESFVGQKHCNIWIHGGEPYNQEVGDCVGTCNVRDLSFSPSASCAYQSGGLGACDLDLHDESLFSNICR